MAFSTADHSSESDSITERVSLVSSFSYKSTRRKCAEQLVSVTWAMHNWNIRSQRKLTKFKRNFCILKVLGVIGMVRKGEQRNKKISSTERWQKKATVGRLGSPWLMCILKFLMSCLVMMAVIMHKVICQGMLWLTGEAKARGPLGPRISGL